MDEPFEIKVVRLESGRFIPHFAVQGRSIVLATTNVEQEAVAMKMALTGILERLVSQRTYE
jgi:hypothetical protein